MIEIRITGNTTADIHDQMHQYLQSAAQVPAPSQAPVGPPEAPAAPQPAYAPAPSVSPQQNTAAFPTSQPYTAPYTAQAPTPPELPGVPTSAPAYTQADLMTAGARLMTTVGMPGMQQLMQRFGVQAIHQLKPEQYGAFAQALRDMGAQI